MPAKKKLAIVQTHPVQYYSPIYKLLTERGNIEIKVFYTWHEWQTDKLDKSFGRIVEWDIPLLEGYEYSFVANASSKPGLSFWGINNPDLYSEIKKWGADAVLVYGWNYLSHLRLMRLAKVNIPVWFRGDSHVLNKENAIRSILKKKFLTWVYSHVALAFYVGKHNRQYFERFGFESSNLIYTPHAVENPFFNTSAHLAEMKEKIDHRENDFVILFVGKLEPVKNPLSLLYAFLALKDKQHCKLVFIGEGPLKAELQALCRREKNIYFPGFQNQSVMPSVYAMSDVLVLPSVSETWGLAVNEAMAAGKAVIVSNKVGCAADLVQNGKNGFIFPAGNVDELTDKLAILSENKAVAAKFGQASAEIIQDWSFEKIAIAIESGFHHN